MEFLGWPSVQGSFLVSKVNVTLEGAGTKMASIGTSGWLPGSCRDAHNCVNSNVEGGKSLVAQVLILYLSLGTLPKVPFLDFCILCAIPKPAFLSDLFLVTQTGNLHDTCSSTHTCCQACSQCSPFSSPLPWFSLFIHIWKARQLRHSSC